MIISKNRKVHIGNNIVMDDQRVKESVVCEGLPEPHPLE